eukprot:UN4600
MRFSSDKGPALNEELKEVEEEGKVRREQLEAETSLMAMGVLTLPKGLGGRLVASSFFGLSRSPFPVHDFRFRLNTMSRTTRNRVGSMDGKVSEALFRGARFGAACPRAYDFDGQDQGRRPFPRRAPEDFGMPRRSALLRRGPRGSCLDASSRHVG